MANPQHRRRLTDPRHQLIAKSTHSGTTFGLPDFGGDSMPAIQTDLIRSMPSIVPPDVPAMSDDECLARLARAVEAHDSDRLDELAMLIGRLAVAIE
jgi:hypothetical protein